MICRISRYPRGWYIEWAGKMEKNGRRNTSWTIPHIHAWFSNRPRRLFTKELWGKIKAPRVRNWRHPSMLKNRNQHNFRMPYCQFENQAVEIYENKENRTSSPCQWRSDWWFDRRRKIKIWLNKFGTYSKYAVGWKELLKKKIRDWQTQKGKRPDAENWSRFGSQATKSQFIWSTLLFKPDGNRLTVYENHSEWEGLLWAAGWWMIFSVVKRSGGAAVLARSNKLDILLSRIHGG